MAESNAGVGGGSGGASGKKKSEWRTTSLTRKINKVVTTLGFVNAPHSSRSHDPLIVDNWQNQVASPVTTFLFSDAYSTKERDGSNQCTSPPTAKKAKLLEDKKDVANDDKVEDDQKHSFKTSIITELDVVVSFDATASMTPSSARLCCSLRWEPRPRWCHCARRLQQNSANQYAAQHNNGFDRQSARNRVRNFWNEGEAYVQVLKTARESMSWRGTAKHVLVLTGPPGNNGDVQSSHGNGL